VEFVLGKGKESLSLSNYFYVGSSSKILEDANHILTDPIGSISLSQVTVFSSLDGENDKVFIGLVENGSEVLPQMRQNGTYHIL